MIHFIVYYTWLTAEKLVAFVLGSPASLQLVDRQDTEILGEKIGRSLHKIPGKNKFSFVDKSSKPWMITEMNVDSRQKKALTATLEDSEDYA